LYVESYQSKLEEEEGFADQLDSELKASGEIVKEQKTEIKVLKEMLKQKEEKI